MDDKKTILIPWDFTEVAEFALIHGMNVAKMIDAEIMFLNIVKKESDIKDATEKLQPLATQTGEKYGVKTSIRVMEGTIFKTISDIANDSTVGVQLVVMGTHGIKGMQKYTGSWALKVITNTDVPFIVVQTAPESSVFRNVVMPIDFKTEEKEKLRWANYIYKLYKTKIHLYKRDYPDDSLSKKVQSNVSFARQYLTEKGIDYEIKTLTGKKSMSEEITEVAADIPDSLILIMTSKELSFQDYVLGADEQKIIANFAHVPVMCVNPRPLREDVFFS